MAQSTGCPCWEAKRVVQIVVAEREKYPIKNGKIKHTNAQKFMTSQDCNCSPVVPSLFPRTVH